jgi:plasmid stability protein
MKVITVRNVPDDLHRALSRLAERNHRSLQQQALVLLERARRLDRESPLEMARSIRERLRGRELGNSVAEIREDRDR